MGWFAASLIIPLYYGLLSLSFGLSHSYIIQDDARQHIVWLQRLVDPQLFPNDVIADYYRAIAPIGFTTFYAFFAKLGIEPLLLAKILPLFIGIVTTIYGFKLFLQIIPIPFAAFISVLILNQVFWMKDDVISASPRAFLYPLFAAFLYYVSKRSVIPCLVTVLLQGLFFPQMVLVDLAILMVRLFRRQELEIQISKNRQDYVLCAMGWAIALSATIPFSRNLAELGATFTVEQMKMMPEFGSAGRTRYFGVSLFDFVFNGASGIRPPLLPPIVWSSIWLPLLGKFPQLESHLITKKVRILEQILIASIVLFLLAHLLFPRIYYPSRYTYHSLRFIMAIAASIVLFLSLNSFRQWITLKRQTHQKISLKESVRAGLIGLLIVATVLIPATPQLIYLLESWNVGNHAGLYEFLAAQPKDILVATLDDEGDNIPAFAGRSVLVSGEFAFAFHVNYYTEMKERAEATLLAQYSPKLSDVQKFIQRYDIDFWLVSKDFLKPGYLLSKVWLVNSSFQNDVFKTVVKLQQGKVPALTSVLKRCTASSTESLVLLDADCIQSNIAVQ
jgi:hypothetical protein